MGIKRKQPASSWADEYLQMVEDCENRESRMSEWEQTFIASIRTQLESERALTLNQTECLDRVWERVTKNG